MGLFTRIQNFFSQNKINILYFLSFISVFFMLGDNAWAVEPAGPAPLSAEDRKTIESVNMFFKMMAVFLTLFTNLVGWFLSPDWTNGTIISGLHDMIKNLWLLVSNVVYFIFAMLFVWIALMNIIGKDGDNYKLKQAIPKFIIGVLIVPFSWFMVQFVVSVSSVLTVAVLSIPYNDFKDVIEKTNNVKDSSFKITTCKFGYKVVTKGSASSTDESQKDKFAIVCNPGDVSLNKGMSLSGSIEKEEVPLSQLFDNQQNSALGLMYVYTYSVMKIDKADALFSGDVASGVTDLSQIIFKFGFSLILFVAYTLLLIAMGFALFIRIIWLRMFAIFSPIFGLLYFFDKKEGVGEGALKNLSFMQLISVAMVPVYVAAALSFGFLFMRVADSGFAGGKQGETKTEIKDCFTLLGPLFTICWEGSVLDSSNPKENQMFHGTIATLFGQFFALIFLWVGVMAALRSSDITKEVVQPIADFGASVGQIIQKGPANLPIIPVPDGKGGMTTMSAKSLSVIGQTGASSVEGYSNTRANELMESHGLFGKGAKATMAAKEAVTYMKNLSGTNDEMFKKYDRALQEFKTIDAIKANASALEMLQEMGKKANVKVDLSDNNGIGKAIAEINNASVNLSGYSSSPNIFGNKMFTGTANEAGVEPYLAGGTSEEAPKTPGTPSTVKVSPTSSSVSLTPSDNNGTPQTIVAIAGGPTITKQGEKIFGSQDITNLVSHSVNSKTVGTMTEKEFQDWLNTTLQLHKDDVDTVLSQVKTAIQKLKTDSVITDETKFWK